MATSSSVQTAHSGPSAGVQLIPSLPAAGRGGILHLVVVTPAAANATVIIYDNINAASGVQLANVAAQTPWSNGWDYDTPFSKGLYAVITGVGADVTVTFE
jgi:hypothetical protein